MLYIMLSAAYPFGRPEDERLKPSRRMHVMLQVRPAGMLMYTAITHSLVGLSPTVAAAAYPQLFRAANMCSKYGLSKPHSSPTLASQIWFPTGAMG